ncbi:MAG TPA: hypothetical protein VGP02_04050 [Mycobacteriales bacterium]|nr:hypothetical protein [Mycobacteriales bacterium]
MDGKQDEIRPRRTGTGSEERTMTGNVAPKARRSASEVPSAFEAVRAEALFASTLQSSESPRPDQVRRTVSATLRRFGIRGCAARVAGEFGDHPDAAVVRMTWALMTVRSVYPVSSPAPTPRNRPLALAS